MRGPPDPRDEIVDHLGALRAFAISLAQDKTLADDLVQETVVKAWSRIETFQPGTNMRAWLFAILRNTFYSDRRRSAREVADVDGRAAASLADKPAHDGHLEFIYFCRAFVRLSAEQREALVLVGAQGFSYEEAAEMCGVAVGTIKSRVNRGRNQLAAMLNLDQSRGVVETDKVTIAVLTNRPGIW